MSDAVPKLSHRVEFSQKIGRCGRMARKVLADEGGDRGSPLSTAVGTVAANDALKATPPVLYEGVRCVPGENGDHLIERVKVNCRVHDCDRLQCQPVLNRLASFRATARCVAPSGRLSLQVHRLAGVWPGVAEGVLKCVCQLSPREPVAPWPSPPMI